jgi:hypothetical protein
MYKKGIIRILNINKQSVSFDRAIDQTDLKRQRLYRAAATRAKRP